MDSFNLTTGDEYDKHCGEVFLTTNGSLIFHCTLCVNTFKRYENYAQHIIEVHYEPVFLEKYSDISDEFDNEMNFDGLENEYCDGLFEEEIPMSIIKQEKTENTITTVCPVFKSRGIDSTKITYQYENVLKGESDAMTENKVIPPFKKVCKVKPKAITMSEKIRLANKEAAKRQLPLLKQPNPRKNNIPDCERKHKCNFCGFAFKESSNLIAHIKRHSKEKNYQCAYCVKMFCTRTEVEEHTRRHTGEKPYVCTYESCTKSYCTSKELNTHMKRHLNERNYTCEICERSFFDKKHLMEHILSHTKERNHVCFICNGKFSRRRALISHMKLHENKREYGCNLCDASFNQKPGLYSHMKKKHKI